MTMQSKLGLLVASILVGACTTTTNLSFTTQQARQAVTNYLTCDECWNHQLYHVVVTGDKSKQILQNLVDNPGVALQANLNSTLGARYDTLKIEFPAITISKDTYIAVHRSAKENRIRARAAIALNLIDRSQLPNRELVRLRAVVR